MPGRASSFPLMRKRRLGGWSPRTLFAGGENGFWFDQTDFSTMFQDAEGTTPVTAVEQPVGLILDKSKGLALGSELATNGDFASSTGWSLQAGWTISGGTLNWLNTYNRAEFLVGANAFVAGQFYKITFTVSNYTSGSVMVCLWIPGNPKLALAVVSGNGTKTVYLSPSATATGFGFEGNAATGSLSIDNISVKSIAGNHAYQATSASRPTLSARVNLLTYTEDFSNAAWAKTNVTQSGSVSDPLGGTKAFTVTATLNGGYISQTFTVTSGHAYTNSVWLRRRTGTGEVRIGAINGQGGPNQAVAVTSTWTRFTAPNAFYTNVASSGTGYFFIELQTSGDAVDVAFPDSRAATESSSLPAYQRVTTTTDYDTSGFPYYLKCDGVDDSLATGTINPGSVDKVQVFAGVRKLSDAAENCVAEYGPTASNTAGSFWLFAPDQTSGNNISFLSRGAGATYGIASSAATSPTTKVVTALGDIAGDAATLRLNGVQTSTNAGDQGTGNYASQTLYIGRRTGTLMPLNGRIYGLIGRFSSTNMTNDDVAKVERWMNNKTKAY